MVARFLFAVLLSFADGNKFNGQIPAELGRLERLTELEASSNMFNGTIPTEFGDLKKLYWLDLNDNPGITGAVPRELGRMSELEYLDLSDTGVAGEFPTAEIGELEEMESLFLDRTAVTGDFNTLLCELDQYYIITANCLPGGQVTCECCTTCCDIDGENCVNDLIIR